VRNISDKDFRGRLARPPCFFTARSATAEIPAHPKECHEGFCTPLRCKPNADSSLLTGDVQS
jgi:hypothetical protein